MVNILLQAKKSHLVALFLVLSLTACTKSVKTTQTTAPQSVTTIMDTTAMIAASNEASLRLMQQVGLQEKGNVWLSPISLGMALRTIYQGAKGETAQELQPFVTAFALENNELLQIADAVWIQPMLPVKKDYLQWCREQKLEIYNENITATKVNDWASRHTQGKINKVLEDPVSKDLMMLIANAVYFKAEWAVPFEERGTHDEAFYAEDGTQTQVKMMEKTAHYDYAKTDTEEVLRLYYNPSKEGHRYVMNVILPHLHISKLLFEQLLVLQSYLIL